MTVMKNKIFLDTSVLIKRYVDEHGSEKVDLLFEKANKIYVSSITRIELYSSLRRKLNERSIERDDYKIALEEINYDLKYYYVIQFTSQLEKTAIKLIDTYQMKTLDSLQLASSKLSKADTFVTSDNRLFKISEKELNINCVFV